MESKVMKKSLVVMALVVMSYLGLLLPNSKGQNKVVTQPFSAGQWTFDSTTGSTGVLYSTNGICLQSGGKWFATTSGPGSGSWYLKDRKLLLHGNYANSKIGGAVNDAFELTVLNQKQMSGFLQEWNDIGAYNGYYSTKWTFVSAKCNPASK